ncbi:hypothetical protein XENORESO_015765 [Xenotaenia resolanae]|uniref:Secreted protein n=1 Tax=Xenotaenia resolanae TaxID=208358 RepID=A0ABV0X4X0_9TELE
MGSIPCIWALLLQRSSWDQTASAGQSSELELSFECRGQPEASVSVCQMNVRLHSRNMLQLPFRMLWYLHQTAGGAVCVSDSDFMLQFQMVLRAAVLAPCKTKLLCSEVQN